MQTWLVHLQRISHFYLREKGCGECRPVQLTVSWMGINILMNGQQSHSCSITGPQLRSSLKPQRQHNAKPFVTVEPNFPHHTYSTTVQKVFQHTIHSSLLHAATHPTADNVLQASIAKLTIPSLPMTTPSPSSVGFATLGSSSASFATPGPSSASFTTLGTLFGKLRHPEPLLGKLLNDRGLQHTSYTISSTQSTRWRAPTQRRRSWK